MNRPLPSASATAQIEEQPRPEHRQPGLAIHGPLLLVGSLIEAPCELP